MHKQETGSSASILYREEPRWKTSNPVQDIREDTRGQSREVPVGLRRGNLKRCSLVKTPRTSGCTVHGTPV